MTDYDSWFRDGVWCLLESPVEGSRHGRIVLVQHCDVHDPEADGSYMVKRYKSEKEADGAGGWRHNVIRLEPLNPSFKPVLPRGVPEGGTQIVAELLEVLGWGPQCRSAQ